MKKTKVLLKIICFISCFFIFVACGKEKSSEKNTVTSIIENEKLQEEIIPQEEIEKREPVTYKEFQELYYKELPEEIGKLFIFLECTRSNNQNQYLPKYYQYFEYNNLEEVIGNYYDILGCSYTDEMLKKIAKYYSDKNKESYLAQCMYQNLNTYMENDFSLIKETYELELLNRKEEYRENNAKNKQGSFSFYKIKEYPYTYTKNNTDFFELKQEQNETYLYANTNKFIPYLIQLDSEKEVNYYYVFLPHNSVILKENLGIAIRDLNKNVQTYIFINDMKDNIHKYCAANYIYPFKSSETFKIIGDSERKYKEWIKSSNEGMNRSDLNTLYNHLYEENISFPIYQVNNRKYSIYDYIMNLPNMQRTDEDGLPTEYMNGINDLLENACK